MTDDKEGFADKSVDRKLTTVPSVIDLAGKRNAEVAAQMNLGQGAAMAGNTLSNTAQSNPKWDRERCLASMIQLSTGNGVTDANKIVRGAQVLYDYVVEGKIPDDAPKGSSFQTKGT